MQEYRSSDTPSDYWYNQPGAVDRWFCGVFEGGGAKGVAYGGALVAMRERKCWFRSVAGASAGAITAALVASGLSPDEIARAADAGLRHLHTGTWAGLRRLRDETGFFPSDTLRQWLEGAFKNQLALKSSSGSERKITFRQLYDATGIELNIVAANLSMRRQVVFSHLETPNCGVADAVIASSSIPFAFPSSVLNVPDNKDAGTSYHHTIVDGGVWSNFPLFVFEDSSFRTSYGRIPAQIDSGNVLGFVLDENEEALPPKGESIRFVKIAGKSNESSDADPGQTLRAHEWLDDDQLNPDMPPGMWARLGAWALYPFAMLGRVVEWNGGVERGRWPTPRSRLHRYLLETVSGLIGGIYPPVVGAIACLVVAIGAYQLIGSLGGEVVRSVRAPDFSDLWSLVLVRPLVVILNLLFAAVAILIVFVTVLGVSANYLLLRAARRLLFGLATTYVAGPGAPAWIKLRPNIIALPVPAGITTLSFGMMPDQRRDFIESARQATLKRLDAVLIAGGGEPLRGPVVSV